MSRSSNSEGCNGPPAAASCLIAGARSAEIQSRPLVGLRSLDAVSGPQSALAHPPHALQLEALLQLVDLRRQGHRIGGVAFEHLDRYRAAVGRAHQADDNLRPVTAVVAAVALLRQFAAASFEIGGSRSGKHTS